MGGPGARKWLDCGFFIYLTLPIKDLALVLPQPIGRRMVGKLFMVHVLWTATLNKVKAKFG